MRCIVIGGGAIGCAVAWRLAQRRLDVILVERGPIAGEATWAAAGLLAPQAEAHAPDPLFHLQRRSRDAWPQMVDELRDAAGIDVGFRRTGTTMVALDDDELPALRARFDWQRAAGLRVEWAEPRRFAAALYLPDDHQVEPRRLGSALGTAMQRAGVKLRAGVARRLLSDGTRVTGVLCDDAQLEADQVIVAAGAWSSLIDGLPPMPRVRPLRGQLVELDALPGLVPHTLYGDGGYLVPRADGRILVGSSEEEVGFVKQVTPPVLARLLERAVRLVPELAQAAVIGSWAGFRPTTPDRLPLLGAGALEGLHLATGHHRNGVLLAPVTAEILAAVVTGEPSPVDLRAFSPAR